MTSQMMTILGAFGAGWSFLQAGLPNETPTYVKLIVGFIGACLSYYLGHTNQGTEAMPVQKVDVKVTQDGVPGSTTKEQTAIVVPVEKP